MSLDPDHRERMERRIPARPKADPKVKIPVGKIARLLAKVVRYAPGGISPAEARDLAADLLSIGASILDRLDDLDGE